MTMAQILEAQRAVNVLRPGRRTPSSSTKVVTPAAQLEIAAQWLNEAALMLTELKRVDLSMQLSRVAHDCEKAARRLV